ncbi:MAG: cytochrome c biogenesis protein CcsA [Pseudomonadota bacterium]
MIDSTTLILVTLLLYTSAACCLLYGMIQPRASLVRSAIAIGSVAALLHGIMLVSEMQSIQAINADFFAALSLVSFIIVVILLLTAVRLPVTEILPIAFFGAVLMILIKALIGPEPSPLALDHRLLEVHVISSLLAYGVLSIAAINAIFISAQHNILHRHLRSGLAEVLPPLTTMESVLFKLILTGWLLLTVSLASGIVFIDSLFAQHLAHKTVLSILAWLIFGLMLFGRRRFGWRGMRMVRLCLIGMAVLLLAYFGSKAVLEIVLDRRWQSLDGA